jgi:malonyl-CoA/methylmalonyl-CoA synthetase
MTNHLFQKIRDAVEGRESRVFLETPAGSALTYTGMITLSGRYAEAPDLGLSPAIASPRRWKNRSRRSCFNLGAVRAGAIFLPLDTACTSAELDYFIGTETPCLRSHKARRLGAGRG